MPNLLDIPPEILLLISENLEVRSLSRFSRCSGALYSLLTSTLYQRAITTSPDSGFRYLVRCTIRDNLLAFIQLLTHGADPIPGGSNLGELISSDYMNSPPSSHFNDAFYLLVDINTRSTLLHLAACLGATGVLSHLLTLPTFNPYMLDSHCKSPLEVAARSSELEPVRLLLDAMTSESSPFHQDFNMDELYGALFEATEAKQTAIVSELLSRRFTDPHDPHVLLTWDPYILAEALLSAICERDTAVAEILLAHGADPDLCTGSFHPLIMAARFADIDMVRMILEKSDDPDVLSRRRGDQNITALVIAAKLAVGIGGKRDLGSLALVCDDESEENIEWGDEEDSSLAKSVRFWMKESEKVAIMLVEAGADIAWAKFLLDKELKEELDGRKQEAMEFLDSLERKYRSKCPIEGLLNPRG